MGFRRQLPSVFLALGLAGAARAADPPADLEAQHQAALAALKSPPVSGLLIIDVQPESAAASAGMRGGDILTEYHGTRVTTLQGLSQLVADAVARDLEDAAVGKDLLARVRRGDRELFLVVPRDILGLRAVEVRSGVPGPRNPPPNPRGSLAFDWKPVLEQLRADNATGPAAFRTFDHADSSPDAGPAGVLPTEEWTGWELCTLQTEADDTLVGTVERYHLVGTATTAASQPAPVTERSTFKFKLRLGDNKTVPAFVLEEVQARYAVPKAFGNAQIVASATRRGETLLATIGTVTGDNVLPPGAGDRHENPAPLSAIPQAALPWVAAALPQSKGDALGLYLLSVRDLLPRPGYVLVTCGKQPLPVDPATGPTTAPATTRAAAPSAWRVDLMLCGVVIESYWFNDQRRLLCVQTSGPQSIVARRVDNAQTAALPLQRKPAPKNPPH
jgi:hypothetical protein